MLLRGGEAMLPFEVAVGAGFEVAVVGLGNRQAVFEVSLPSQAVGQANAQPSRRTPGAVGFFEVDQFEMIPDAVAFEAHFFEVAGRLRDNRRRGAFERG
jgi:hypothetical protein